jgi:hypothetical protein
MPHPGKHRIFDRVRLTPSQLRTVASRRFSDADALRRTGKNERANGVMYLSGFVVECLLKAKLLSEFPWLQNAGSPQGRSVDDQRLWSLCYRSHDLEEILARLPKLARSLEEIEQAGSPILANGLKSICAHWTIFARYSPSSAMMSEAVEFLTTVKELKEWLK